VRIMKRECKELASVADRMYQLPDIKPGNIAKYETYDARRLAYIVTHPEEFAPKISDSRSRSPEECMILAFKYLANSELQADGTARRRVEYHKGGGRGRWVPNGSQSLANITRKIRQTIANERYVDIDCVNCHPVILMQLCDGWGIETPYLDEYVNKRAETFAKLQADLTITRDVAKTLMLEIINGGRKSYKQFKGDANPWLKAFKAELERIADTLIAKWQGKYEAHLKRRRAKDKWPSSDRGAFVNMFMLDKEAEILDSIVETMSRKGLLGANGLDVVLCADGLMAKQSPVINDALLRECEQGIARDVGMTMRLEFKPMEPLELPAELPMPERNDSWLPYMNSEFWDEFPYLAAGMPVIAAKTKLSMGYHNNQTFKIASLAQEGDREGKVGVVTKKGKAEAKAQTPAPMVVLEAADGAKYLVTKSRLRTDFRPAYCITAHKAQGSTIDGPHAIHEFDQMGHHGAYVALTRHKRIGDVQIIVSDKWTLSTAQLEELVYGSSSQPEAPSGQDDVPEPNE
jgi:hypothetical protein